MGAIILVLGAGFGLTHRFPTLLEGPINSLTSVGTFITLYGVLFAVIELFRLKSVALIAAAKASEVYDELHRLRTAEMATRCQTLIHAALRCTEQKTQIPDPLLNEILSVYRELFAREFEAENNNHGDLEGYVMAYVDADRSGRYKRPNRTIVALIGMSTNLAARKNSNVILLET